MGLRAVCVLRVVCACMCSCARGGVVVFLGCVQWLTVVLLM